MSKEIVKSNWKKIADKEVVIKRAEINTKFSCAVLSDGEHQFTAYPKITVHIDGVPVMYEPCRRQDAVL